MKYPIEQLLTNEKILCHEIRASTYQSNHVLLHFFITEPKNNDNELPQFSLGYERYKATNKEIEKDDSKPEQDNIEIFAMIKHNDHPHLLFNYSDEKFEHIEQQKNDWTGEQPDMISNPNSNETSSLSPISANNIAMNKNLRNVSEMADNSIYRTDDVITEKTYLSTQDSSLQEFQSDTAKEIHDNEHKKYHSIWTSHIHFNKFEQCNNVELLDLLRKYKPYIGLKIPPSLDSESPTNIDMESIFGTSFDFLRIKNKLTHKNDDDDYESNNVVA